MGYEFIPLAIETGERQAEVTEAFLCRLIDIAGCGDAPDRARFRNYAASRIPMTNAIGVAKTAIANRPIASVKNAPFNRIYLIEGSPI